MAETDVAREIIERGNRERTALDFADVVGEILTAEGRRQKGTNRKDWGDLVMENLIKDLERELRKKGR